MRGTPLRRGILAFDIEGFGQPDRTDPNAPNFAPACMPCSTTPWPPPRSRRRSSPPVVISATGSWCCSTPQSQQPSCCTHCSATLSPNLPTTARPRPGQIGCGCESWSTRAMCSPTPMATAARTSTTRSGCLTPKRPARCWPIAPAPMPWWWSPTQSFGDRAASLRRARPERVAAGPGTYQGDPHPRVGPPAWPGLPAGAARGACCSAGRPGEPADPSGATQPEQGVHGPHRRAGGTRAPAGYGRCCGERASSDQGDRWDGRDWQIRLGDPGYAPHSRPVPRRPALRQPPRRYPRPPTPCSPGRAGRSPGSSFAVGPKGRCWTGCWTGSPTRPSWPAWGCGRWTGTTRGPCWP
jgi:hypothetical protein